MILPILRFEVEKIRRILQLEVEKTQLSLPLEVGKVQRSLEVGRGQLIQEVEKIRLILVIVVWKGLKSRVKAQVGMGVELRVELRVVSTGKDSLQNNIFVAKGKLPRKTTFLPRK